MLHRIGLASFGSQQPHFGGLRRLIPALDAGLAVRARAPAPPQRGSADHKVGINILPQGNMPANG